MYTAIDGIDLIGTNTIKSSIDINGIILAVVLITTASIIFIVGMNKKHGSKRVGIKDKILSILVVSLLIFSVAVEFVTIQCRSSYTIYTVSINKNILDVGNFNCTYTLINYDSINNEYQLVKKDEENKINETVTGSVKALIKRAGN